MERKEVARLAGISYATLSMMESRNYMTKVSTRGTASYETLTTIPVDEFISSLKG